MVADAIWQQEEVQSLWVGGSIARGDADEYSDIDLRVAVAPGALEAWKSPNFERLFQQEIVGHQLLTFGENAFLHHLILECGDIYDLWVQSVTHPPSQETVLILGRRDEKFAQQLSNLSPADSATFEAPRPESVRQALVDYWIVTHKHRKVLYRNLYLLSLTGVEMERLTLLRFWFIAATGHDYDSLRHKSIFGLTHVTRAVEKARGPDALKTLGAPLRDRTEIYQAIELLRDEVSEVGRHLAQQLEIEYPVALERTARREWDIFMERA